MNDTVSRLASRLALDIPFVLKAHIFNPMWRPREERRKRRYDATFNYAMSYLRRYAPEVRLMKPGPMASELEPERAFTLWLQGEEKAPELVRACFRSMRRHLKQELVVLDEKTLFDWIQLPDYIVRKWRSGKISHAAFSDICRVELLYRHGGLWLDATDYVTGPVPDNIMREDFFVFMAGNKIRGSYAKIQSCFIRARKHNPLLGIWRQAIALYWEHENSNINYFWVHLLLCLCVEQNDTAREHFAKMPKIDQDPTHALWGNHCGDPYDEAAFRELTADSFFQKTNFKDKRLHPLRPGSVAEHIIMS